MGNEVSIAPTSPYAYAATVFFALSAVSSDLLFIRFALMLGFFFLVMASLSSFSADGSFSQVAFVDGEIDITMIVNACLCLLNFAVFGRLIQDEIPRGSLTDEEQALFRFFRCRCGLTRLEFDEILRHGQFLELEEGQPVPQVGSVLYLVLDGVVECRAAFGDDNETTHATPSIFKRSGQFFDIRLFNLFTLPIGFDSHEFQATTKTRVRLFGWSVHGLVAMRDSHSPSLQPYWEYMVLRGLAGAAVRHHLRDTDTLYDAWLVPEDSEWLQGAPSRDFGKEPADGGLWSTVLHHVREIQGSLFNVIPPKGVRHGRPSMVLQRNPRQDVIEVMAKAKLDGDAQQYHFLAEQSKHQSTKQSTTDNTTVVPTTNGATTEKQPSKDNATEPKGAADRSLIEQQQAKQEQQDVSKVQQPILVEDSAEPPV
ncbi:expressed unknown protein [Seminavis robusta]|uniref:Uncharacterized protein n=1 Tax=Seminavis robusta TaxID=568900 RepID=A0A9N8HYE5_9STRA|nr:expressed unknown protein [Seminavis robusta]|eukprot:Sro2467_g328550.1 n/a (425) ;mRNA; f:11738-13012